MFKSYLSRLFMLGFMMCVGSSISAQSLIQVSEPADIAGLYYSIEGAAALDVTVSVSGALVDLNDGDDTDVNGDGTPGTSTDGCQAATNDLTGAIALIDVGECTVDTKAANAEAAGAVGIILCNNNAASPTQLIVPGAGTVSIPTVGMSLADCTTLRSVAGVMLTITPSPNVLCAQALEIEPGVITVDSIMSDPVFTNQLGFGASALSQANGATFAMWYSFTASTSGLVNVNSCLGGEDTRLKVWTGACDVFGTGELSLVADDDDTCPFLPDGSGNAYASSVTFYATAGTTYLIEWDDRWSNPDVPFSFSFELFFEDTPFEAGLGEDCANAIVVDAGVYTVDTLTGFGANADNSLAAEWYSFTPSMDGIATISSCASTGASEDTRVLVYNGECGSLEAIAEGEDECDALSQVGPFVVTAGTTYLIEWTDTWEASGFDWELSLIDFPMIDVTMSVDMSAETVDPAGVFIAYGSVSATTAAELSAAPLVDNGDGTWSTTIQVSSFDTLGYAFINGTPDIVALSNVEVVPSDCGVSSPLGINIRVLEAASLEAIVVPTVCYASCSTCEPEDCNDPLILINDDVESYLVEEVTGQATHWGAWPGGAVGGIVSTEIAQGLQSILIDGAAGTQDALLLLGDQTEGHFLLSFDMYLAAGSNGYFNLQHEAPTAAAGFWAFDVYLEAGGNGRLELNDGRDPFTFSYTEDAWFTVQLLMDIENDIARMIVGDNTVAAWQFSTGVTNGGADYPSNGINSINFYPADATNRYFVDNVSFAQIPEATEGNYCYTAVGAALGTNTTPDLQCFGAGYDLGGGDGAEKGYWFTWTATEDGVVTIASCGGGEDTRGWIFAGADCMNLVTVGVNDDQCDIGTGNNWASYREAVVTAGTTYYIMWDNAWGTAGFDWDLSFTAGAATEGNFCQTAFGIELGGEYEISTIDGHGAVTGPIIGTSNPAATLTPTAYVQSEWYTYTATADITATISSCDLSASDNRVWVYTGDCSSFEALTLVASDDDGCGTTSAELTMDMTAGTTYYIEWDDGNDPTGQAFAWTFTAAVVPTTEVTFTVDMSLQSSVSDEGVFISGPFNGWADPGTAMTDDGNGRWSITLELEEGSTVEYKFQNGTGGWEVNPPADCNLNNNRFVEVGSTPQIVAEVCFNHCVTCDMVLDIVDPAFAAAINIFPNPTSDQTAVNYNFETSIDLTIRVINTLGQVVKSDLISNAISGTHTLDVSDFAAGMYMIQITDGERVATQSLVVE